MSTKNTGGPAFPVLNDGHHMLVNMDAGQRLAEGMSLRDYFAAKVLPQVLANVASGALKTLDGADASEKDLAQAAYALADAMLAERAQ